MPAPKRRLRIALVVVTCLVLAVVGLSALGALAPASLTTTLIAHAERATGRVVTVAGGASLSLLPTPAIVLRDATIANPAGFPDPVMVRATEVRASLDPVALLTGRIRIAGLSLVDPDLAFERLPDGRANWTFRPAPSAPSAATAAAPPAPHEAAVAIDSIDATGGTLAWRIAPYPAGHRGWTGRVALVRLHALIADGPSSATLAVLGQRGEAPFELSVAGGAPARLTAATATDPYPLRAVLTFGPDRIDRIGIDGTFDDPRALGGFQGAMSLHLTRLNDLSLLFPHAVLPDASDIDAEGRLRFHTASHPELETLRIDAGAADLSRLHPGLALERLAVRADAPDAPIALSASGTLDRAPWRLDSRDLATPSSWSRPAGTAPFEARASLDGAALALAGTLAHRDRNFEASDTTLHLRAPDPRHLASLLGAPPRLRDPGPIELDGTADLTHAPNQDRIALSAAALRIGGDPLPPSDWTLQRLAGRDVTLDAVRHGTTAPWLHWTHDLANEPHREALALDATNLPAALVAREAGVDGLTGSLAAKADLAATDDAATGDPAPRTIAGTFDLLLSRGRIDPSLARATIGPLLGQARGFLLHDLGDQDIHCAGAIGSISDGVATLAHLSLDTPSLTLDGTGTIDLAARSLALTLQPQVRLGPAGASSPVSLTGPIDAPHAAFARAQGDRFTLSFGRASDLPNPACDLAPGIGVPPRKTPKPLDMLRSLGLFR